MRSIFITNDDGIDAEGIIRLANTAKEFGDVWVVAPDGQRSAASHSISLREPVDVYPHDFPVEGVHAFSCNGTPADCVRVGTLNIMPHRPDVVLAGINNGYNVASDVQYSATVGAALEGAFQGYRSIAFSEDNAVHHEVTDAYLREIMSELLEQTIAEGQILNVNFPSCKLSECQGIIRDCTVSRGMIYRDHYLEQEKLPNGGVRLMVEGEYNEDAEEGTDFFAVMHRYISIGIVKNIG